MPVPVLMSHVQSQSTYKQGIVIILCTYISLCHIPLSIARACCICEGLTLKFRDDIRDLMDLRETQAGVAPLDNAVNTKGTRPGVYPCVCTRRAAYVHLTHSLAVSAAMRGLPRRHVPPTQRGPLMGGGSVDGGGRGWCNTNTSANFGLLYACWELAGPESERERGWSRTDRREWQRGPAKGARKGETERGKEKEEDEGEIEKKIEREVYVYMADT